MVGMPLPEPDPTSGPSLLDYSDYSAVRQDIRDKVLDAVATSSFKENDRYAIRATDVRYDKPSNRFSLAQQKMAILEGRTLSDKITGNWEVIDKQSGDVVSRTGRKTLVNVPYFTDRGTFIRNGTEYTVAKQLRLNSGVYTRISQNNNIESQFNAVPRSGPSFRVYMEPSTSYFYMKYKNRKIPLYPVLRGMGVDEKVIEATWGKEIADKNRILEKSPYAVNFLKTFSNKEDVVENIIQKESSSTASSRPKNIAELIFSKTASASSLYTDTVRENLVSEFGRIGLDPSVTLVTLGEEHSNASPNAILSASSKILRVSRGQDSQDSRDSLQFQDIYDTSDFISDKIKNDQNGILRQALWKITKNNGDSSKIPTGLFDKHVQNVFVSSGLAQAIEEINPLDMYDQNTRVSRLGEGAMSSIDVVPKEARNVQPSYLNYMDPVRAPESLKIGVDMKLARNVRRGSDKQLYSEFIDVKSGQRKYVGIKEASSKILAWPEYFKSDDAYVIAMVPAKGMQWVKREEVDYVMPSNDDTFSSGANLVPLKSGVKGMRLLMGSKFGPQALPLLNRQAPFVQTMHSDGKTSSEHFLGKYMGAVKAPKDGVIKAVRKDRVEVSYADGSEESIDIYNNFPFARKTFIRNDVLVKAGDSVKKGDVIASSNFTDNKGVSALGLNLRTAYLNYDGKTFEDAVVISESAAKKLTSEHMYRSRLSKEKDVYVNKDKFKSIFPSQFNKAQLDTIDNTGLVKPGTFLKYGDPVILAVKENDPSTGTSIGRKIRNNASVLWEHKFPGVVTDAVIGKDRFFVNIRANVPAQVGDKLANRFGAKGVIADIIKDSEMPTDPKGRSIDIIQSPLGIVSRTNPAQKIEVQLGKVAEKTGIPYVLPGFIDESLEKFAERELRNNRLSDQEDLFEPKTGKTIPKVFTGMSYFYKMQHTSEGKGKSRSQAKYTAEDQPAKGGKSGAKHLGKMEIEAFLAHGADKVLKDLKLVKGQKNDDFWRQLKLGKTPTMPKTPLVYDKFKALIRAAGVQLTESNFSDHIFAMTDSQAKDLTGDRKIKSAATYTANGFKPIAGGLFDPTSTGSDSNGDRWSYIDLPEPMPNPVMLDPIRRVLNLKQAELEDIIVGKGDKETSGPEYLFKMLSKVNIPIEKEIARNEIKHGIASKRDDAIKRFTFLDAFEKNKVKPTDFMMTRVPVLPPRFRPISVQGGMSMVADPNYLYKSLIESIDDFKETEGLPTSMRADSRQQVWDSYKSLIGIADPKKEQLVQKNVKGILSSIFGKGSPKTGFFQRRVLGTNIDLSGLGVVAPNPALKLNQVGIPEDLAWNLYEPFIIRELVQRGVPALSAANSVKDHDKQAYAALQDVISRRPVILNRAPSLHKYSIMSFWPVLTKGSTVQVPPSIVGPFAMDFDGDTASFTVPVSSEAVDQAINIMMPDKNLISSRFGKAAYKLSNEYSQGLYYATKKPSEKQVSVFNTVGEAIKAYNSGKLAIDDPVTILE